MRTRNVVREELRQSVAKCKNTAFIETLVEIAEIYRKLSNDDTFEEVSELEREKYQVINDVMRQKSTENIKYAKYLLRSLEEK